MEAFLKNKKAVAAALVVVVLVVLGGIFFFISSNQSKKSQMEDVLNNEEAIPTVDASVQISLKAKPNKKEVELSVKNMPSGTKSVEYELSYDAQGQGPQGAIGTVELKSRESFFSKTVTLGTCSSGTCVYHTVVGPVRLSLIFNGGYGQRIFEKEYDL
ncbi:hypothetical protein A3G67_04655 [Candidatus Roizmanbacteria bacterium RIFCSPLOWO2_12_FULL_40_12]|uniref:Uncharacterized protein n=1 Tax=Candidatus Roizmanbacteria bacterium RIFCSPLOWO2_01_FULL_40_42 TaxID=1802066 RepID=A0A1F7J4P6_9BACT|nr:MAG: hypothetical protein A2779_04495 [Candidatus Roizmanbacteria bacterium RIFCSPHIGHO2_01_FULL_40_98]OGK27334.1 MAG: hypothetical protein A3C31_04820 [Candidatus Roizmanbacteria bacterium RIFCSPHIGHO2_02_FULL_40_53]OGK30794.1 MAG: hypothetical protein A2W49_02220 [Candidatus Roizmanbacteria bacterium RIFCSPHIGHO2_12_41_18]OGK36439.1 MAG: hypothetical protein A3E69_02445 [Candidatus Roizmanbacteria bacterium RIFCSPHIGHO2_12_FULL_40_130]OGK50567.1 MAG: hypothetical protein A3B50_02175 [Candi